MVKVREDVPNTEFALASRVGQYLLNRFEQLEFTNDAVTEQLMAALLVEKWPTYSFSLKSHSLSIAHYTIKWAINSYNIIHYPISVENKVISVLSFSQDNKNDARTRGHLLATHLNIHTPITARFARDNVDYSKDLKIQCLDKVAPIIEADKITAVLSTYDSVRLSQIYINSIRLVNKSLHVLADSILGASDKHVLLNNPISLGLTNLKMELKNSLCVKFDLKVVCYDSRICSVYFKTDESTITTIELNSTTNIVDNSPPNIYNFNLAEDVNNFFIKINNPDNFMCVLNFCLLR